VANLNDRWVPESAERVDDPRPRSHLTFPFLHDFNIVSEELESTRVILRHKDQLFDESFYLCEDVGVS
jgi:hypothetical protein